MKRSAVFVRGLCVSALTTLLLAGCSTTRPLPPEVHLSRLQVTDLSLSHAALAADLRIFNPNRVPVTVEAVDYHLSLDGVPVSSGHTAEAVRIAAGEYGDASLRLSSAYLDIWRILSRIQGKEAIGFNLAGKIKVGGFGVLRKTFDFDREGEIPLLPPGP